MLRFGINPLIILIHSFIFVPQIIKNIKRGNTPGFYSQLIFGLIGINFLIPFYARMCPDNVINWRPVILYCTTSLLILTLSVIFMYMQYSLGARFFIPKYLLPGYY